MLLGAQQRELELAAKRLAYSDGALVRSQVCNLVCTPGCDPKYPGLQPNALREFRPRAWVQASTPRLLASSPRSPPLPRPLAPHPGQAKLAAAERASLRRDEATALASAALREHAAAPPSTEPQTLS